MNQTAFRHIKVLVLTLSVLFIFTQIAMVFSLSEVEFTQAVETFWDGENVFFRYIEENRPHAAELAERIESSATVPDSIRPLLKKPIYRYLYIIKPPTLVQEGIGLIECRKADGSGERIEIPLKKLSGKTLPSFDLNFNLYRKGDVLNGKKAMTKISISSRINPTDSMTSIRNEIPLSLLFYSPDEIMHYECTAEHKESGEKITTTKKTPHLYTCLFSQEFLIPKPKSDSFESIESVFHVDIRAKTVYGETIPIGTNKGKVHLDTIQFEKKVPWVDCSYEREMLETMPFSFSDRTKAAQKNVYVDYEKLSESDAEDFLSGNYFFPLSEKDTVHSFSVEYISADGAVSRISDHVICYTLKPTVNISFKGTPKQNHEFEFEITPMLSEYARKMSRIRTEGEIRAEKPENAPEILENLPDRMKAVCALPTDLIYSASGENHVDPGYIQREVPSDYLTFRSFDQSISIVPDIPPALILMTNVKDLLRGETLKYYSDAVSIDGDEIEHSEIRLFRILETSGEERETEKSPDAFSKNPKKEMGKYKLVLSAREKSNARIRQSAEKTVYFQVVNVAPVTAMTAKGNPFLPMADIVVITDAEQYAKDVEKSRSNLIHALREKGVDAVINHWDRTAYVSSMEVETNISSGSSYPDSFYSYETNGYSGRLKLDRVSREVHYEDRGKFVEVKKTHTVSEDAVNTSSRDAVYRWKKGSWILVKPWAARQLPYSKSLSCGEHGTSFSGYKKKGTFCGGSRSPDRRGSYEGEEFRVPFCFTTSYSGQCSYSQRTWQSNMVPKTRYSGTYRGTVSKTVSKPYAPSYRHLSDKLTCYYNTTDRTDVIRHTSDQNEIFYTGSPEDFGEFLIEHIQKIRKPDNVFLVQETVALKTEDRDLENDPMEEISVSVAHDPSLFRNPDNPSSVRVVDSAVRPISAGKYKILRVIQDLPPQIEFCKTAQSELEIIAHRKPIADFEIDWKFQNSAYEIRPANRSYDPDVCKTNENGTLQGEDAGIYRSIFRYKKDGEDWKYLIPSSLTEGNYTFSLAVQDEYGAWSEECIRRLALKKNPDIELSAKLEGVGFHKDDIPAGEKLRVFGISTKYHSAHDLTFSAFGTKTRAFGEAHPAGMDRYTWDNVILEIPDSTPDGTYRAVVIANGGDRSGRVELPFRINTPIHVTGTVAPGDSIVLEAESSSYAASVEAVLFLGTPYERKVALKKEEDAASAGVTRWVAEIDVDSEAIPSGTYTTKFEAKTAAGKTASFRTDDLFEFLSIQSISTKGEWNLWKSNRYLGYEKIRIEVGLSGNADRVEIRFSPELEAMSFRNAKGILYRYRDEFGYTVNFPLSAVQSGEKTWDASYILPVANDTIDWKNRSVRPPYRMTVHAYKGSRHVRKDVEIHMTGNIHDLMYIRPLLGE